MIDIENKATRALQRMRAAYDQALAGLNITSRQFVVLRHFAEHPDTHQQTAVDETGIDRSTLAGVLDRLEERGLVSRKKSKDDARANLVSLTAAGSRSVERANKIIAGEDARLMASLSEPNRRTLATLLDRIGADANQEAAA